MLSSATSSAADARRPPAETPAAGWTLSRRDYGWCGAFQAMASPCEVHIAGAGRAAAERIVKRVASEAWRIERKFSRYRDDNIVARINSANGRTVNVDAETARLLDYSRTLFELSEGRFDVSSGVLRRAWRFDGGEAVPSPADVEALRARVGWQQVDWRAPVLRLEPGMEIDFGGIGKEYAVDRAAGLVAGLAERCLINFGGDLVAVGNAAGSSKAGPGAYSKRAWTVGVEDLAGGPAPAKRIELRQGALATSGDARRFVISNGRRYGHILDARTGWPVEGAPRSITVAAPTCTEAGMLATFAMLMGHDAERFLEAQGVAFWCLR